MGTTARALKQWSLLKNKTINSFENWRQNLVYTLWLDTNFAPFLANGATWKKKTRASPYAASLMTEKQYRYPDVKQLDNNLIFSD